MAIKLADGAEGQVGPSYAAVAATKAALGMK
jgi:hypothetical protein